MADEHHGGQPIIVKKIKKGHGGHHGGAWKVAYADFVTAMMALFIVLWILGNADKNTKQYIAAYFKDPKAFDRAVSEGVYNVGKNVDFPDSNSPNPSPAPLNSPTQTAFINENATGPTNQGGNQGGGKSQQQVMEETAKKITAKVNAMPELSKIKDQVEITIKNDMAIIELVDKEKSTFFELGDANMKPNGKKVLAIITNELKHIPNKIIIAGHTDSHPFISGRYYSNWELSADRANTARRIMEEYKFDPKKILEVRGNADRSLKFPDDPYNPRNRRISIIVMFNK